jgi:putative nucleotidyltransferase with HDIG domain
VGEDYAGQIALERRSVTVPDLREGPHPFVNPHFTAGEDFVAYCGVPLIAKGQVKGVMEVLHRARLTMDAEWLDALGMLAEQAAIAIDNAQLFESLQRTNTELLLAYDITIEGWSRALDLRDKETEGHTRRVAELAEQLAAAMGLSQTELTHIRRGALLHDIGKMAVPDDILLKPGPLTDDEWTIMRKHPEYGYGMLAPITFLRPALDIPYCHHEKWDGTGYPRGLRGEVIPLAARIFAVVDVWDALRSDRPYRKAWNQEKVCAYIKSAAGTHFDPAAVAPFMRLIGA